MNRHLGNTTAGVTWSVRLNNCPAKSQSASIPKPATAKRQLINLLKSIPELIVGSIVSAVAWISDVALFLTVSLVLPLLPFMVIGFVFIPMMIALAIVVAFIASIVGVI